MEQTYSVKWRGRWRGKGDEERENKHKTKKWKKETAGKRSRMNKREREERKKDRENQNERVREWEKTACIVVFMHEMDGNVWPFIIEALYYWRKRRLQIIFRRQRCVDNADLFLRFANKIAQNEKSSSNFESWWNENGCSAAFTYFTSLQKYFNQVHLYLKIAFVWMWLCRAINLRNCTPQLVWVFKFRMIPRVCFSGAPDMSRLCLSEEITDDEAAIYPYGEKIPLVQAFHNNLTDLGMNNT